MISTDPGEVPANDWGLFGLPPGVAARRPQVAGETPDPEYVQANLFTLTRIGGIYDEIALIVEHAHRSILDPWRLDSKAPTVIEYLRARDARPHN